MNHGMSQRDYDALIACGQRFANELVAKGMPREQAVKISAEAAAHAYRVKTLKDSESLSGLGDPMEQAHAVSTEYANIEAIKKVRETVTPWLWILSIYGAITGVMNTRRIAKMYSDWKRKQGIGRVRA